MTEEFDVLLSEKSDGAVIGITFESERAKSWVSTIDTRPWKREGNTLLVECLCAAAMLAEARTTGLTVGYKIAPSE